MSITASDLEALLLPSLAPCVHFTGVCAGKARWEPEGGHVPRGYIGSGKADCVDLVIVTAEPGDPSDDESYAGSGEAILRKVLALGIDALSRDTVRRGGRTAPFHRNLRKILDACWPGLALSEQVTKTWIISAVLCSARRSGDTIPPAVADTCGATYLAPQLKPRSRLHTCTRAQGCEEAKKMRLSCKSPGPTP